MMTPKQRVKLSEEQKAIVYYNEGEDALVVKASAGSGKTRVLTERVRYLLTEKSGSFHVLCLTFTNKAAEEMQERLKNVRDIKNRAFIGTIHGFALEVLQSRRQEIGFSKMPHIIDKEEDRKKIIEQVLVEDPLLGIHYKEQGPDLIPKCLSFISEAKRNLIIIDDSTIEYNEWSANRLNLFKSYNAKLREQNMIDFDDLLVLAWQIFNESPSAVNLFRRLYKYILVDEAQDLTFAQYYLIKTLCGDTHRNVFMVGDPNQAINAFAGADKTFMEIVFVQDFGAKVAYIHKNYRSSQRVIDAAKTLAPNPETISEHLAHYQGRVEILPFTDVQAEADWIIGKIHELLAQKEDEEIEGGISLEKMVILARNRFVFMPLMEKMRTDEVLRERFFLKKGTDILESESEFMRLFDWGTRIIANPANQIHMNRILSFFKIQSFHVSPSVSGIEKLKNLESLVNDIYKKHFIILLEAWQILNDKSFPLSKALDCLENYSQQLGQDENKDAIIFDIQEWRHIWKEFRLNTPVNAHNLTSFRQFTAMGFNRQTQNKGLTLATIHTAKGLEFDIVFLMGMNEGTLPFYKAVKVGGEQLEEEKNIAYVALTRARRWLYITYPQNSRGFKQQPSRYIQNIKNN